MHAIEMSQCIQRGNFDKYGALVLKTWEQKKQLDLGTNPPEVEKIIRQIKDYALGYKLPGAGGGGYLYIVAKSPEAAAIIKNKLTNNPPNSKARFVDLAISNKGFQVTRSQKAKVHPILEVHYIVLFEYEVNCKNKKHKTYDMIELEIDSESNVRENNKNNKRYHLLHNFELH